MGRLIDADLTLTQAWQNFYKQEDEHEKTYENYDIFRDRHFEQCGFECCQQTIVLAPTVLTIPDNPTNGDMIKALFPNFKFNEEWKATRHFELQSEQGHIEITGIATSDWWNAPYKGAEHENTK